MSNVVFVSAGQCGNQLGYSILSKLNEQLSGQQEDGSENVMEMDFFFRSSGNSQTKKRARCVCLDTEPKAGMVVAFVHIIRSSEHSIFIFLSHAHILLYSINELHITKPRRRNSKPMPCKSSQRNELVV